MTPIECQCTPFLTCGYCLRMAGPTNPAPFQGTVDERVRDSTRMPRKYILVDETTDMPCGFDYESFLDGFYCESPAVKVIIEVGDGFHWAHLCAEHGALEFARLGEPAITATPMPLEPLTML